MVEKTPVMRANARPGRHAGYTDAEAVGPLFMDVVGKVMGVQSSVCDVMHALRD